MALAGSERTWRLGIVSYLNARPLIAGLETRPNIELLFDVPARLPGMLERGEVDVALVPVVDLARSDPRWQVVSDACIGCDGETLTVRIFSRVPPERIRRLHVDGDSHTSVALATIIWRRQYNQAIEIVPFRSEESVDDCEAILLIGDKVVNHTLIDHEREIDLGAAWKSLTSLPFVFAVWAAPPDVDVSTLAPILAGARDAGVESAAMIAADIGPGMGWPVALAQRYLTARLKFTLSDRHQRGMTEFFRLAHACDLIPTAQDPIFP